MGMLGQKGNEDNSKGLQGLGDLASGSAVIREQLNMLGVALAGECRGTAGIGLAGGGKQLNWLLISANYSKSNMLGEAEYSRTLYNIMDFEAKKGLPNPSIPISCEYRSVIRLLEHSAKQEQAGAEARSSLLRVVEVAAEYLKMVSKGNLQPIDSTLKSETYAGEARRLEEMLVAGTIGREEQHLPHWLFTGEFIRRG